MKAQIGAISKQDWRTSVTHQFPGEPHSPHSPAYSLDYEIFLWSDRNLTCLWTMPPRRMLVVSTSNRTWKIRVPHSESEYLGWFQVAACQMQWGAHLARKSKLRNYFSLYFILWRKLDTKFAMFTCAARTYWENKCLLKKMWECQGHVQAWIWSNRWKHIRQVSK